MDWFLSRGRGRPASLEGEDLREFLHHRLKLMRVAFADASTATERRLYAGRIVDLEIALGIRPLPPDVDEPLDEATA